MTRFSTPRRTNSIGAVFSVALAMMFFAVPASAQYGGTGSLIVEPVLVPDGGTFEYFGTACPPDSTVSIFIDGFPDLLSTTVADSFTSYQGSDVPVPEGVIAGQEYTVRAICGSFTFTFDITAVCSDGSLPLSGECSGTVSGVTPTTTTTTAPGGSGGSGDLEGANPDDGPNNLAITGASYTQIAMQIAITFMAFGGMILLASSKRREADAN